MRSPPPKPARFRLMRAFQWHVQVSPVCPSMDLAHPQVRGTHIHIWNGHHMALDEDSVTFPKLLPSLSPIHVPLTHTTYFATNGLEKNGPWLELDGVQKEILGRKGFILKSTASIIYMWKTKISTHWSPNIQCRKQSLVTSWLVEILRWEQGPVLFKVACH